MPATNWWCFTFEARRNGSIGAFEPLKVQVRSDDEDQALDWALDDASAHGYEVCRLIEVKRGTRDETKGNI